LISDIERDTWNGIVTLKNILLQSNLGFEFMIPDKVGLGDQYYTRNHHFFFHLGGRQLLEW
jgi:hypothetical protein